MSTPMPNWYRTTAEPVADDKAAKARHKATEAAKPKPKPTQEAFMPQELTWASNALAKAGHQGVGVGGEDTIQQRQLMAKLYEELCKKWGAHVWGIAAKPDDTDGFVRVLSGKELGIGGGVGSAIGRAASVRIRHLLEASGKGK